MNLIRAIPLETEVLAEGVIDHAGRSTAVATGRLTHATTGQLYATGSTTCLIMKIR